MSSGGGVGRHASWLELFFDLVAVAAIQQLAHRLHESPSLLDVGVFMLLYLAVWLAWSSFTLYANIAGKQTARRAMLAAMFGIAVMAAAVPDASGDRAVVFIVAYAAVRFLGARIFQGTGTNLMVWPSVQGMLGVIPWVVSIWVAPPGRYWLWAAGLAIDILVPLVSRAENRMPRFAQRMIRAQAEREGRPVPDVDAMLPKAAEVDMEHLAERLGLFVIIVLGEAVLQVVTAAADRPWTGGLVAVALAAFALLVGLWWHLFRYGLIAKMPVPVAMPLHFVGTVSITAMAVGLGALVAHPTGHSPDAARWLLCAGLAGWSLAGVLGGLPDPTTRTWMLWAGIPGIAVPLLLGAFGATLSGVAVSWLLVAVIAWHWLYSAHHERRRWSV